MIHDTQCHVPALYELVRSGKREESGVSAAKRMGDEIETLFDRLILPPATILHSQRLPLITSRAEEFIVWRSASICSLTATAFTRLATI